MSYVAIKTNYYAKKCFVGKQRRFVKRWFCPMARNVMDCKEKDGMTCLCAKKALYLHAISKQ